MANDEAYELLECFSIGYAKNIIVKNVDEINALEMDFPVVAKIEHSGILHKSDVGGVVLNIQNKEDLVEIYNEFMEKFKGANGVLVQEQLPSGIELIVGSSRDPQLGSAIMVGMGGTLVEVLNDVRFLYPPVDRQYALSAIRKLKCYKLLEGYRGESGVDIDALAGLMTRISDLLLSLPDITELDLNPVIYNREKRTFLAADVRIKRG